MTTMSGSVSTALGESHYKENINMAISATDQVSNSVNPATIVVEFPRDSPFIDRGRSVKDYLSVFRCHFLTLCWAMPLQYCLQCLHLLS